METHPLEIENLTMIYGGKGQKALSELSLTVSEKEVFGYLGPNGAGKTTTLKILVGLLRYTSGSVRMFGRNVGDSDVRTRIGFVPEDPRFYEYLTAGETLRFFGRLLGLEGKSAEEKAGKYLETVGLSYAADTRVGKFSRGMRQRLGLAQALLNGPDLLLLDEPLSGLDPVGRAQIRDVILEQAATGKTVFFSSHVLPDVEAICSRVGIICEGRLRESGTIEEMLSKSLETVEIVVSGLSEAAAASLSEDVDAVRKTQNMHVLSTTDSGKAQEILKRIIAEGAAVESVSPRRETLEDYFMRRMGSGGEA